MHPQGVSIDGCRFPEKGGVQVCRSNLNNTCKNENSVEYTYVLKLDVKNVLANDTVALLGLSQITARGNKCCTVQGQSLK